MSLDLYKAAIKSMLYNEAAKRVAATNGKHGLTEDGVLELQSIATEAKQKLDTTLRRRDGISITFESIGIYDMDEAITDHVDSFLMGESNDLNDLALSESELSDCVAEGLGQDRE